MCRAPSGPGATRCVMSSRRRWQMFAIGRKMPKMPELLGVQPRGELGFGWPQKVRMCLFGRLRAPATASAGTHVLVIMLVADLLPA